MVKSEQFFTTCLLPEILGHRYTRPPVSSFNDLEGPSQPGVTPDLDSHLTDGEKFCFCNGPDEGSMIWCDNDNCKIM